MSTYIGGEGNKGSDGDFEDNSTNNTYYQKIFIINLIKELSQTENIDEKLFKVQNAINTTTSKIKAIDFKRTIFDLLGRASIIGLSMFCISKILILPLTVDQLKVSPLTSLLSASSFYISTFAVLAILFILHRPIKVAKANLISLNKTLAILDQIQTDLLTADYKREFNIRI